MESSNYFSCNMFAAGAGKYVSGMVGTRKEVDIWQWVRSPFQARKDTATFSGDNPNIKPFILIRSDGGVGLRSGATYYIRGYNRRFTPWKKRVFLTTRSKNYKKPIWAVRPDQAKTEWTLSWDSGERTLSSKTNASLKAVGRDRWLLSNGETESLKSKGWTVNQGRNVDDDLERECDDGDDCNDVDDFRMTTDDWDFDEKLLYPHWAKSASELAAAGVDGQWQFQDCSPLGTADLTGKDWYEKLVRILYTARCGGCASHLCGSHLSTHATCALFDMTARQCSRHDDALVVTPRT